MKLIRGKLIFLICLNLKVCLLLVYQKKKFLKMQKTVLLKIFNMSETGLGLA